MQIFSMHWTRARHKAASPNSDHCRKIPRRPINSSWNCTQQLCQSIDQSKRVYSAS